MSLLSIENLRLVRGSFELALEFASVEANEVLAVMGPSGCGKSSLLLGISGFVPTKGKILVREQDVSGLVPEQRKIALVFQKAALFSQMRVWENVAFGLRVRGFSKSEQKERAMEWLSKVEMQSHAEKYPDTLSGGESQRVALARALIVGFPVLLLDEPFTALDPVLRKELRSLVKALISSQGTASVLVTHDWKDAETLADKILILDKGQKKFYGTLEELKKSSDPFIQAIVQS